jgi:ribosome modulation factor
MNDPRERGLRAGIAGEDPRICPYEKMTREWNEWQRWHGYGLTLATSGSRPDASRNGE